MGPNRENPQGENLEGFNIFLEGIWGNPSLAQDHEKLKENQGKARVVTLAKGPGS